MRVFVCATKSEAQGLVDRFRLKKSSVKFGEKSVKFGESGASFGEKSVNVWLGEGILLFICGVGFGKNGENAQIFGEILAKFSPKTAINFGICGCNSDEIGVGEGFLWDENSAPKGASLICVSTPQTTKISAPTISLYDMESAKFKEICAKFGVKFKIYKVVSDHLIDAKIDKASTCALLRAHAEKIGEL
ncbi:MULTISPECIES: hypothetical protein [unclassified Campylobacter]|uniref:hypothetical protein n=1 Tax=unclassified Campylobacter TaxID=2593542 RepID=UPI0022E9D87A|nr:MULTISPECIES: hypothetical protein [unclassified Campylobacter]MDA3074157.1 hypothetical protein [Campylobacter sp. JMF_10 EL2]